MISTFYFVLGDAVSVHAKAKEALQTLIDALKDSDAGARVHAAQSLRESVTWVSALSSVAEEQDGSHFDREPNVTETLGKLGVDVVSALIAALADSDSRVRSNTADTLGSLGDVRAVPALEEALHDADADVRVSAALALSEIGTAEVLLALARVLNDSNKRVRSVAAKAIERISGNTTSL